MHITKAATAVAHATDGAPASDLERIERVINDRMIRPAFQPIIDLRTGEAVAFEGLTRPTPASGFSNPLELFDMANRHGLRWSVEALARQVIFAEAAQWPGSAGVFVNVSPTVASDARFATQLLDEIHRTNGLTPHRVTLEITEQADPHDEVALDRQLDQLRRAGVRVAVDDLGAGAAGLTRVVRLRPEWIKLDRELVGAIDSDPLRREVVRLVIDMADASNARLIAEGVERQEQLETLSRLGVKYAQGYLLGRPDPTARLHTATRVVAELHTAHSGTTVQTIGSLTRPVLTATPDETAGALESRCEVAAEPHGVVIADGRACIGWIDRARLFETAVTEPHRTARSLLDGGAESVDASATLHAALRAAALREPGQLGSPLIVAHEGVVVGVVPLDALLLAASEALAPRANRDAAPALAA